MYSNPNACKVFAAHEPRRLWWNRKNFTSVQKGCQLNRHVKQRTALNKHLGNFLPVGKAVPGYDPVKHPSDCPACATGDGTRLQTCSHVPRRAARIDWRKQSMSSLRKKLHSSGTEIGLMEMLLTSVKSALTRVAHNLRNLGAAQEATGWTHLFKGRISKQWTERQHDHIDDKAAKKNLALN